MTDQITGLLACPVAVRLRRAAIRDSDDRDFVREEALVYLIRDALRRERPIGAGDLCEQLVMRATGAARSIIAKWHWAAVSQRDECLQDALHEAWVALYDLSDANEFWEVRFWTCLERCVLHAIMKHRTIATTELSAEGGADSATESGDVLMRLPDNRAIPLELQAEVRDALTILTEQERTALILFRCEQWSQQETADQLGVSDRTVRNILARAEKRLAGWREGKMQ